MRLLLDTCTFLWVLAVSAELSPHARELFSDPANEVYLSTVSVWEISVKHALGRLPLPASPSQFVPDQREQHGIDTLALEEEAVLYLPQLPEYHKDPFDRMLICQAIAHQMTLVTPDTHITQYAVRTAW